MWLGTVAAVTHWTLNPLQLLVTLPLTVGITRCILCPSTTMAAAAEPLVCPVKWSGNDEWESKGCARLLGICLAAFTAQGTESRLHCRQLHIHRGAVSHRLLTGHTWGDSMAVFGVIHQPCTAQLTGHAQCNGREQCGYNAHVFLFFFFFFSFSFHFSSFLFLLFSVQCNALVLCSAIHWPCEQYKLFKANLDCCQSKH